MFRGTVTLARLILIDAASRLHSAIMILDDLTTKDWPARLGSPQANIAIWYEPDEHGLQPFEFQCVARIVNRQSRETVALALPLSKIQYNPDNQPVRFVVTFQDVRIKKPGIYDILLEHEGGVIATTSLIMREPGAASLALSGRDC
jgi:hypothetical protein